MAENTAGGGGPPAAPQRRWQAPCPNCGAPVAFQSAASAVAICGYCRSTVVRDDDSLRKIGESAELFDEHTPLQLGTGGSFQNRKFTLIGRLQWGYSGDAGGPADEGRWNEWRLQFDDSGNGWLSEDNDQYVLVFDVEGDPGAPPFQQLAPGQPVALAGKTWRVASLVNARALAAEGELPSIPPGGSTIPIADLRNESNQVATLEYAVNGPPRLSIGQPIRLAALALSNLREGFNADTETLKAQGFPCPECGAPIEVKLADTRSLTCSSCHSVVDISKGVGAEVTAYRQGERTPPRIPLGSTGVLAIAGGEAISWQVVGFSVKEGHAGNQEDSFTWQDYLLYNREEGFAFLVDSNEGWIGFRTLTGVPTIIGAGAAVDWNGGRYRLMDRYPATVRYVEGEFYWQVVRGQVTQTFDYNGMGAIANRRLSSENTQSELVWSQGVIIPSSVIQQAFPVDGRPQQQQQQVNLADVRPVSGSQNISWVIWLIVIIVILILLSRCGGGGGYYGGYPVGTGGGSYGGYSSGGGHK